MFFLPIEIQRLIYEFDPTYHCIYKEVLSQITNYKIFYYRSSNFLNYYVYNPRSGNFHITNSLNTPFYIFSVYNISPTKLKSLVETYQLIEDSSLELAFDIENVTFTNLLLDEID